MTARFIYLQCLVLAALTAVCAPRAAAQRPPAFDRDTSATAGGRGNGDFGPPGDFPPDFDSDDDRGGPMGGPQGGGGPMGGGPGMMQQKTALLKAFDANEDGYLDAAERKAARAKLNSGGARRRGPGGGGPGGGGPGGFGARETTPTAGRHLTPADVPSYPGVPLYDPLTLRTLFLEFEDADWEKELADFKGTDVEVPARLTVDGKTYNEVGVHFHGNSSYSMVSEGRKRSLVLSLDLVHSDQQLEGYRKLNLLNSHEDGSFLRTVLAMQLARDTMAAPKANFVRVVINGECWGIYVNQQHFNKDFVRDNFGTTKGSRWKIAGNPGVHQTFAYLGDDPAPYKRVYEIKSKDDPAVWAELIKLCKTLNQTPPDRLEEALAPLLDVEGALRFLAWDNVMANGDGFWTRNSDIDLYMDKTGRFHIVPYDANECFSAGGGPGGGGPGGGGPGGGEPPQGMGRMMPPPWMRGGDGQTSGTMARRAMQPGRQSPSGQNQDFGPPDFGPQGFEPQTSGTTARRPMQSGRGQNFGGADFGSRGFNRPTSGTLARGMNRRGGMRGGGQQGFGGPPQGFGGGPGGGPGGGMGGGGTQLDPLVAASDTNKPLIAKLLAVPALRARYLQYVRELNEQWLDWNRLGPIARQYHALIDADVKADTRKIDTYEAFASSLGDDARQAAQPAAGGSPFGPGGGSSSLKSFVDKRHEYLAKYTPTNKDPITSMTQRKTRP